MNRHERRRQKKSSKLSQTVNPNLLQGIKLHTSKNYKEADKIRDELLDKGVLIEDKDGKTTWKFK